MKSASSPTADGSPPAPAASAWAPLGLPNFRALWLANVVSDIGGAMHVVGAGVLMTTMSPSPLVVSLVQAATMLPMFLLVLPAGVLGDVLDRRKLLIFAQLWALASALLLGVSTLAGWMSPALLLVLTFMLSIGAALATPPFQSIVAELVPRPMLPSAVPLNSMGVNIARAAGPALGGLLISLAGVPWVFLFNAASFLFVVFVLWRWKRMPRTNPLPPEQFLGAIRNGWRYARRNPQLQSVLVRAVSFFAFASALWALLPLVGRMKLAGNPNGYALLLSCMGVGAVLAALTLPRLRTRVSPTAVTLLAALLYAGAVALAALTQRFEVAALAMVLAGWAWLASLSTLNTAAQLVIAEWVKGRGLAMYQIAFFGSQALGSMAWGQLAQMTSITTALLLSSAGLVLGCATALRYRLAGQDEMNLQPSLHWPEPRVLLEDTDGRGVILTTVEYQVEAADVPAFVAAMHPVEQMRRRNGSFGWGLYEDMKQPGHFVEQFLSESWMEHMRLHQRTTESDRAVQEKARAFHRGPEPPRVAHWAAPGPQGAAPQQPLHRHDGGHTHE